MEPKIGDRMKVSPQLTDQADWIDGEVIDVEQYDTYQVPVIPLISSSVRP